MMLRTVTPSLRASTSRRLLSSSAHSLPSAAYTDPSRHAEPGVSSTPDITPEQRQRLDAALRVDQAGEIAANYIYKGQLAVLGKHPVAGPLIQVSPFCGHRRIIVFKVIMAGHVEPGEETSSSYEQAPGTTSCTADCALGRRESCWVRVGSCHGAHE